MKVRIGKLMVDVLDSRCKTRKCFSLGFDKGTYTQGRGYTSYHCDAKGRRVEYPMCWTRHMRGCPSNSCCPKCHTISVLTPGEKCGRYVDNAACDGVLEAYTHAD